MPSLALISANPCCCGRPVLQGWPAQVQHCLCPEGWPPTPTGGQTKGRADTAQKTQAAPHPPTKPAHPQTQNSVRPTPRPLVYSPKDPSMKPPQAHRARAPLPFTTAQATPRAAPICLVTATGKTEVLPPPPQALRQGSGGEELAKVTGVSGRVRTQSVTPELQPDPPYPWEQTQRSLSQAGARVPLTAALCSTWSKGGRPWSPPPPSFSPPPPPACHSRAAPGLCPSDSVRA